MIQNQASLEVAMERFEVYPGEPEFVRSAQ
jgi:hypothetical protein